MARRKSNSSSSQITKTKAVKDYLAEHPDAKPKEIAPAVKEAHGLDISPQMISMIKSKMGKDSRRRGRKPGTAASGRARGDAARITIDELVTAKKLVDQMGGIARAQQALAALARLS